MYGLSSSYNRASALTALECLGSVNFQTTSQIQVPPRVVNLPACP